MSHRHYRLLSLSVVGVKIEVAAIGFGIETDFGIEVETDFGIEVEIGFGIVCC